jgi:hypothetical protein
MTRFPLCSWLALSALLLHACVDDGPLPRGAIDLDAGADAAFASPTVAPLPLGCAPIGDPLPKTLSCTGLYGAAGTGPIEKAVHPVNRAFAPGTALWTDGADKLRWIAVPEGKQIDTSDPNGWVFPDGTRVWKEFAFKGKRAETRFMYKSDIWLFATYKWNDDDTDAVAVDGGEVAIPGGGIHTIPTLMQCNDCHRGSRDKLLGFQQVLLGLPGAKGLDLSTLVAEKRLSNPPLHTHYVIPDDGTGLAGKALSYIHVNCGVSCHNETGNAGANMSKMFLRIDPASLDAPTTASWNIIKMTVGVPSVTANFLGGTRIVPGSPDASLIVQLAQTRGSNRAMPPIGTRITDPDGLATLRDWITRLGPPGTDAGFDAGFVADAGAPDSAVPTVDAAIADASSTDAQAPDAAQQDGEVPDGDLPDAGAPIVDVPDAEVPDAGAPDGEVPDTAVPPVVVDPGPVVTPPVVAPPVTEPPVVTPPVVTPPVVTPPVVTPPVVTEPPVAVEPPVAAAPAS